VDFEGAFGKGGHTPDYMRDYNFMKKEALTMSGYSSTSKFFRSLSVILAYILLLSASGCSKQTPRIIDITEVPDDYWSTREYVDLSPNGTMEVNLGQPLSITDKAGKTLFQDASILGPYNIFESWFPDNSGFVIYDADQGCEKCSFDRLIVYQINKQKNRLDRFVFEPLTARNTAFRQRISWSPDNSQFAVIVNYKEVDILDRDVRVVQRLQIDLDKYQIIEQGVWTKYGFLYIYAATVEQLGLVDVGTQKQTVLINDATGGQKGIISVDPYTPRIIIFINNDIDVFNLETKEVEQTLYTINVYGCFSIKASDPSPYIAILMCDNQLHIFDWRSQSMQAISILNIEGILEWRPDLGEFVLEGNKGNHFWLEYIKP
jgi:hypothetical protein